jgi:hypothetical protein
LLQTYLPKNPEEPKTVATTPLKLLRPPVPRFMAAKFVVLRGFTCSDDDEQLAFNVKIPNDETPVFSKKYIKRILSFVHRKKLHNFNCEKSAWNRF